MAPHAILTKLADHLSKPPEREADVVYTLVEIRKFLEHTVPESRTFGVLKTYCDWVVHARLSYSGAKTFLQELGAALSNAHNDAEKHAALEVIHERFSLTHFKAEFRQFLSAQGLPLRVVDDSIWWTRFLKHYTSVVSDCPLESSTHTIRRATLRINGTTESIAANHEPCITVIWVWNLEFEDGTKREYSMTVVAV